MALDISSTSETTTHLRTSESTLTVSEHIFANPRKIVSGTKRIQRQYLQSEEKETFFFLPGIVTRPFYL
jgi:hypothetical protein